MTGKKLTVATALPPPPVGRTPSQEFGPPPLGSTPSQEFGPPSAAYFCVHQSVGEYVCPILLLLIILLAMVRTHVHSSPSPQRQPTQYTNEGAYLSLFL